ncbi:MAG: PIN domain-containing protein [Luteitalea sp.]|nr:PIN domain-containing protein [Luteitalea sp.]
MLDSNVWLATIWARHVHHAVTKAWFDRQDSELALCRVTQMALLRHTTNSAVTGTDALTRRQAWDFVEVLMADPRVSFRDEPDRLVPLWVAFSKKDDRSHKLWTDDYLAAFALAADADLVTLDEGFQDRYPSVRVTLLTASSPEPPR